MIPQTATVQVHSGQSRRIRLRVPMVAVYLVLSPLLLLLFLVLLGACAYYRVNPIRALGAGGRLVSGLRGLHIDVRQGDTNVLVKLG